jgi:hypothetical protein
MPNKKVKTKKCNCWDEMNERLREHGKMMLSDELNILQIDDGEAKLRRALPLMRLDGKKPRRDDPKHITISHCPFCGTKL